MAITKEKIIARIEVVGEYKIIQVAYDTIIKEDGTEISRNRHRNSFTPDKLFAAKYLNIALLMLNTTSMYLSIFSDSSGK